MNTEALNRVASKAAHCAVLIASIALLCAPAQAQSVRKCRIDGRIVFQASPCLLEPNTVAAAPQAVAAGASGAPKKKTLSDRLRERDSSDRAQPQSSEAQDDGANVLRSRMGAV